MLASIKDGIFRCLGKPQNRSTPLIGKDGDGVIDNITCELTGTESKDTQTYLCGEICLKLLIYIEFKTELTKNKLTYIRTTEKERSSVWQNNYFGKVCFKLGKLNELLSYM